MARAIPDHEHEPKGDYGLKLLVLILAVYGIFLVEVHRSRVEHDHLSHRIAALERAASPTPTQVKE